MSLYSIIVLNNDSECYNQIEKVVDISGCTTYILRLQVGSKGNGPFNIYTGSTGTTPIYSALTKSEINVGVPISINCP